MEQLPVVSIFTDGACVGNPGPGGYAAVLVSESPYRRRELSGGFRLTTNNRMEMMAAILGLEALRRRCRVTVYSDSRYLVDSVELGWVYRWRSNSWMRNSKEVRVNVDLWERLLAVYAEHEVDFRWVRGHAGHAENERCDQLAESAARSYALADDTGYVNIRDGQEPAQLNPVQGSAGKQLTSLG